jgi:hypothetical protein
MQSTRCYVSQYIYFNKIKRSTCFRRFPLPSSGAQIVHTASGLSQTLLLPAAIMVEMELQLAARFDKHQKLYVQFELLMMGGGTA